MAEITHETIKGKNPRRSSVLHGSIVPRDVRSLPHPDICHIELATRHVSHLPNDLWRIRPLTLPRRLVPRDLRGAMAGPGNDPAS
jgi:hypothetical protein